MPSPLRFTLQFSGSEVFSQHETARDLLVKTPTSDHAARARLYAVLAAATVFSDPERSHRASDDCATEAALAGDAVSLAWAKITQCIVDLSAEATPQRLGLTREILASVSDSGDEDFVAITYFLYLAALAELGLVDELDRALSPVNPILSAHPALAEGRHVAWFRCLQATLDGRIDAAEQLAHEALKRAQADHDPDALSVYVGQLAVIRWAQGRVVELEPMFLQARQAAPHEPIWAVSLAWMWLRQGRKSAARALVSSLPRVDALPVDRNWLSTACILADVVSEIGDTEIARDLYRALRPFEDRLVTIGLGVTCWGTVARALALVARSLGDSETAIGHYRHAIDVAARVGAHAWLAEAQWELAELIDQRGHDGDHDEAIALASEAVAAGRALHLVGIEGSAARVLAALRVSHNARGATPAAPFGPASASGPAAEAAEPEITARPRISVLDGFSVTSAQGVTAHWQSRKARQLLKILVARRGAGVSRETVMDLLWPDQSPDLLANRFSVATTAVRRALDPEGRCARNAYIDSSDGVIRLQVDAIDIDIERFLSESKEAITSQAPAATRRALLTAALALYEGDPLAEEQEESWAAELRRETRLAFFAAAHELAEHLAVAGEHVRRLDLYRRVLALDEYDQRAHEGLIHALEQLGSHGQAETARNEYERRMRALGVPHQLVS